MEDLDYVIMYIEQKLGTGAVMEMMDYIEDKKAEEIVMSKHYVVKDLTFSIVDNENLYYKSWDERYEVGNIEGMELTEHKGQAFKFPCHCDAHKFIEQNGLRGHCFVEEM
ncbi:hypothetical protein NVP1161O_130 [Vibrio phage 1.161.O._10N.261.48.C5]|nr:hypothetical protein NVP1161O_130 [Vibrio phage 1.161.O._10N.261.48.C5]